MHGLAQDGSKHRHGLPVNEVDDGNSEQNPKRKPCATRRKIGRGFVYRLRRCRHKGGCGYLIWRNRCPRSSPRCGWTYPAPLSPCDPRRPEQRKQQFGHAVSLFQMRIPGKNKTFNTKVGMLQHSVSDGRGIAHQRGARVIALSPSRLPPSAAARTLPVSSRERSFLFELRGLILFSYRGTLPVSPGNNSPVWPDMRGNLRRSTRPA
jgi:hypothetical protein